VIKARSENRCELNQATAFSWTMGSSAYNVNIWKSKTKPVSLFTKSSDAFTLFYYSSLVL